MKHILLFMLLLVALNAPAQSGWYVVPGAPVTYRFEDVSFIGNTGWVADNNDTVVVGIIIYKTTDGGNTWNKCDTIITGSNFGMARSVEFINDSIGFIGTIANANATVASIYRTTDGGNTFDSVVSPALQNGFGVCGMAHYGNTVIGVGRYDGERHFYKSTDAGLTWTAQVLDTSLVDGLVDCYMFNDSIYIASGQGMDNGIRKAVILKTYDGGTTWQRTAVSTSPYSWGWKIHFLENGVGTCSLEHSDKIFMTNDSGTTWTEHFVGLCSAGVVEYGGNGFLNDSLGWVADQFGSQCMFETRDGGTTWQNIYFGNSIDRMVKLDSVTMLAVGGKIYKFSFDSVTTTINEIKSEPIATLSVHPNPADATLNVKIGLRKSIRTHLLLLNENYQVVKDFPAEYLHTGNYNRQINTSDLPTGNYMVILITDIEHCIEKVQIVH